MTTKELINKLNQLHPDTNVMIADSNGEPWEIQSIASTPATGLVVLHIETHEDLIKKNPILFKSIGETKWHS